MLKRFSTLDATFIVLMAACGIALKPVVGPMAKLIGSAFLMPSGVIAGSIYMMWPVLALLVVRRFGTAMLIGLIEGIIVLVTGFYGSHGILSLLVYLLPCIFIDLVFLLIRNQKTTWLIFFPPAVGNIVGLLMVGVLIIHMPTIPLLISMVPGFIFGGLGGLLAWRLYALLVKSFPQFGREN